MGKSWDSSIERRIIIGLIVSGEYLQKMVKVWHEDYLESAIAKLLATWCFDYYREYNEAPGREIESLYSERSRTLPDDIADEIEDDILPSLNDEYIHAGKFNVQYLIDQTLDYFKYRHVKLHTQDLDALAKQGDPDAALKLAEAFKSLPIDEREGVLLGSEESMRRLRRAFNYESRSVIQYPGALGRMMNNQLVREGFVSIMASEKRGKSFLMLDMALRAAVQYSNVAFFDAGDMSEDTIYLRLASYITERPVDDKDELYIPVRDCLENQTNRCDRKERECSQGLDIESPSDLTYEVLIDRLNNRRYRDYSPCRNCDWGIRNRGSHFYQKEQTEQLDPEYAERVVSEFFGQNKSRFKLSRHDNFSLTVREIRRILDAWERDHGFVPDVIVVDYADLLIPSGNEDYRHRVDTVWKELRGLAQHQRALVITATQADAKSYEKNIISLANFSEDKRKYSHVTAMYGLNQDKEGKEKQMGLMRINELVVRSGSFSESNQVYVLQNLDICRPYLGSFTRKSVQ